MSISFQSLIQATSRENAYVVISGQLAGVTKDKKLASNFSVINSFIRTILDQKDALKLKNKDIASLKRSFNKICKTQARWYNFISIIFTRMYLKSALKPISFSTTTSTKIYDYGKNSNGKSLTYACDRENKLKQTPKEDLSAYNQSGDVDFHKLSRAFQTELKKKFTVKFEAERIAYDHICCTFDELIDELANKIECKELTPSAAKEAFKEQFMPKILAKKTSTDEIDRPTFIDLVGERVKGGKGSGLSENMPFTPQIKQLINDCNDGQWATDELKVLTYDYITPEKMAKVRREVVAICEPNSGLDQALLAFFESL